MMRKIAFETPVLFCAGEASGDLYAGFLIKKLKEEFPEAIILSIGDGCMVQSGAVSVFDCQELMTFGLSDSLISWFRNLCLYRKIVQQLHLLRPRTFVPVAYPGINLLLCRVAKRLGMKVYYFLPPQIWVWGTSRKYLIRKWVDAVISVFPFEADFYRALNMNTLLIDNPLVGELRKFRRNDSRRRIGFMPGSRQSQIKRNLPVALELARVIRKKDSEVDLCIVAYDPEQIMKFNGDLIGISVIDEDRYQVMKNCDLLLVCSGTASLEAAFLGVPQLFFNRPSFLDYYVFRRFLKTREYNLTNICYGERIVPSFVEYRLRKLVERIYPLIESAYLIGPH
jgi:lipid-A-disaccharide synthase